MYKTAVALGANPAKALHKVLQIREFEKKFNAIIERWGVGSDENLIMRLRDFNKKYSNSKVGIYIFKIKKKTSFCFLYSDKFFENYQRDYQRNSYDRRLRSHGRLTSLVEGCNEIGC